MVTHDIKLQIEEQKLHKKILHKLETFMKNPVVESFNSGSGKKAYINKSFQVMGTLFSIELAFAYKLDLVNGEFFLTKEQHLMNFHSRSKEGGYYIYNIEDIAKYLHITIEETNSIFERLEALARMTPQEVEKAKGKFLKKVEKSARKLTA